MKKGIKYMLASALSLSMALPVMTNVEPVYAAEMTVTVDDQKKLVDAINNQNVDYIVLDKDLSFPNNVVLNDRNVTLDLNGKLLQFDNLNKETDGYYRCFKLINNSSLTLRDSEGGGKLNIPAPQYANGDNDRIYAVSINGSSTFNLESGSILSEPKNGSVLDVMGENSAINITGGSIHSIENGKKGSEIFESSSSTGNINISGGSFVVFNKLNPNDPSTIFNPRQFDASSAVGLSITGGKFSQNPNNFIQDKVHYLVEEDTTDKNTPYHVVRNTIQVSDWVGKNDLEQSKLYVYNSRLATITNENSEVYEINSINAENNYMYKTISNAIVDDDYSYKFEYTNRTSAGTTDKENTFELFVVPGTNPDIQTEGTVKLGMYHGFDDAWTTAHGMFTATNKNMTLVLKPLHSSGLGGIIKDNFEITENNYVLNEDNVYDGNVISCGDFNNVVLAKETWKTIDEALEVGSYDRYTRSKFNKTNVLEINYKSLEHGVVYQTLLTKVAAGDKINYTFDTTARTTADFAETENTINVYLVPGESVENYKINGVRVATVLGTPGQWQSSNCTFVVPDDFGSDKATLVFETESGLSGCGGIVDNVSVNVDSFAPIVEKVTDTMIVVSSIENATYKLVGEDGKVVTQNDGVFTGLNAGKKYEITVSKEGFVDVVFTEITSKQVLNDDSTQKADVTNKTTTSLTIDTIETQEYSIDDGKTWIKGTGNPYTFSNLESGKEYSILTRIAETFDTMPTTPIETKVRTVIESKDVEKPKAPLLKDRTENSLTFTCGEDEEMSIDDGETWVKGSKVVFTGLEQGEEYNVLTRKAATVDAEASEPISTKAKTAIKIGGTVNGKDLPATVVITDMNGQEVATVKTDEQGNWSLYVDEGKYNVKVIGANKEETTEMEIEVSVDGTNDFDSQIVAPKPAQPILKDRTENSLTFTCGEGEEMSIDSGKTWVKGPKVVFGELDEGTEYAVLTRRAATDNAEPSEAVSTQATTLIKVGGTVIAKNLPATITVTDANGNEVTTVTTDDNGNWSVLLDKGEYHVEVIDANDNLLAEKDITVSTEDENDFDVEIVLEKPNQPTLKDRTENSLTFTCGEDEEMSIDGGKTWVKGPKVVFTGLEQGKEYTVLTRRAATEIAEASETVSTQATTLIKIAGTVTGKKLPAKVVIKDAKTGEVVDSTLVDVNGNWSFVLEQGNYHIEFIDANDDVMYEKDITVSADGTQKFDIAIVTDDSNENTDHSTEDKPVNTSDPTNIALYAYSMMIAGAAIVMGRKRKEDM